MKRYSIVIRFPFFCAVVALAVMGIFAKRGYLDWRSMVNHNGELERQIQAARLSRDELEKQIRALETSPFAQEQAVRQHLGYLRKDEIVVELP
jgi:cell division protein FtsB